MHCDVFCRRLAGCSSGNVLFLVFVVSESTLMMPQAEKSNPSGLGA